MTRTFLGIISLSAAYALGQARSGSQDRELARRLAAETTREAAVAQVVGGGPDKVRVLLAWADKVPANVNAFDLDIGLSDAFGRMKTKEAIPFLIRNISIDRTQAPNTWLKSAEVIEARLPAAAALVQIGPDAATALVKATWGPMLASDRLTAIFVISRMRNIPEARAFLSEAAGQANQERYWAEDGLKRLNEQH